MNSQFETTALNDVEPESEIEEVYTIHNCFIMGGGGPIDHYNIQHCYCYNGLFLLLP